MFRQFIGPHAPQWIGQLATIVTVFSAVVFALVVWYLATDRRTGYRQRMSNLPLDDGQESSHV